MSVNQNSHVHKNDMTHVYGNCSETRLFLLEQSLLVPHQSDCVLHTVHITIVRIEEENDKYRQKKTSFANENTLTKRSMIRYGLKYSVMNDIS